MKSPQSGNRNGFAGGAVLVVIMTVVLVAVMVVVIRNDGPAQQSPAAPAGPADSPPAAPEAAMEIPVAEATPEWTALESPPGVSAEPAVTAASPASGQMPQQPVDAVPNQPVDQVPNQPASPALKPTSASYQFMALAGNGCAETATSGSSATFPAGSPVVGVRGGWSGPGCAGGTAWSVPMSGAADRSDSDIQVTWWFSTGTLARGSCAIWLFVPKPTREMDAAGKPSFFQVTRGRLDSTVVGTFSIDQPARRGEWVRAGSYPLEGGSIGVRLLNRGAGTGGARHGAGQVQVGCTR
ncbi:hypothetical protein ABT346_04025 [Micromonospora peucetia]|uniref:hypothetical protein n=1 Tax=Micromonospora peucetia TaxID=47871 RepID=UPI00331CDFFD